MNILVSACLLGEKCRYDGQSKPCEAVLALSRKHNLIAVCPEVDGGLSVPRPACERVLDRVLTKDGVDKTSQYKKGAELALKAAVENDCKYAVLKLKSPACSPNRIYDGSFSHKLVDGYGVAAQLLLENGIKVLGEDNIAVLEEEML